ncbi:hypothetical protein JYJ95_37860 [Corallococcus exiguus]|uniref:hypothetical protein n=1 Tax=Corallococcus exiguus TaxID=83462 RepID=UPI001A8F4006|nr:hypothetical protein [Corallococcus exiguus]MBN8472303.1 hypothetical protein [Corallococcus exiguus]
MPIDKLTDAEKDVILKAIQSVRVSDGAKREIRREIFKLCLGTTPDPCAAGKEISRKLGYDELLGPGDEE